MLLLLAVLSLTLMFGLTTANSQATVFLDSDTHKFFVKEVLDKTHGVAWAVWNDTMYTTGWAQLWVETNDKFNDEDQSYAAGMVEGYVSHDRMYQMWTNYNANEYGPSGPSNQLRQFMEQQKQWTEHTAAQRRHHDPLWYHTHLVMRQFAGITAGYNMAAAAASGRQLPEWALYFLTSLGDLETLNDVYNKQNENFGQKQHFSTPTPPPLKDLLTDCSALIKVVDNDVYFAHATWRGYYEMLRVYKVYNIKLHHDSTKANTVSFASSPGFLSSKDDFYILNSGLAVMETTNSVFNTSLYSEYITPQSLLVWQRVIVANRIAGDGQEWTQRFAQYNSGTYNNQWMVLSYPLFESGRGRSSLPSNTFWILEQIPGRTKSADMTQQLDESSFWSSFNIPYFKEIYDQSGYVEQYKKYGDKYSYENCPRANIFRRNQTMIHSFKDMQRVMRFNDWKTDPLSLGEPYNAIASRYDLSQDRNSPFGAVDAKITSCDRMKTLQASAICGPTHQEQDVFAWDNRWPSVSRMGVPERFDFEWVEMKSKYE